MWMRINTANAPTYNNPPPSFQLWIILEYYSKLSRCIRGESKKKNWYKSKSAGVRWKQKASWALQMFALYHLNSSHWLCQEWIALAQSEAERNLCYCAIFSPQTTQTVFFPLPLLFSFLKPKSICAGQSHRQWGEGGYKSQTVDTDKVISCI